jgi:receptor protein-tyrosine kinase
VNAEAAGKTMPSEEREFVSALSSLCGLTLEDVHKISAEMGAHDLSFAEAALKLGLATPEEIQHAATSGKGGPMVANPSGLVELVVRKLSASRALVVSHGTEVKPGRRLTLTREPYSAHSEQIRALRTELQLRCPPTGKANVIAVLSANHGEGRSQLAAELAISFAQLGARTLLVDADFRHPFQHELFDCENVEGLSQAVEGKAHASSLHPVEGLPEMTLLTAGPVPPNPVELLSDGRFAQRMMQWRDKYAFVVLDTPPISRCSDGLAVAAVAGRVLMVTRAKHTPYRAAKDLLRRLVNTQAQVLGAVVNNF